MPATPRKDRSEEPRTAARDRARAAETAIGQLEQRDIRVEAGADPERVAELLEAVERFEGVVASLGGDSMINTLDSSQPERPQYVLPERARGESLADYASRVRGAAERLRTG